MVYESNHLLVYAHFTLCESIPMYTYVFLFFFHGMLCLIQVDFTSLTIMIRPDPSFFQAPCRNETSSISPLTAHSASIPCNVRINVIQEPMLFPNLPTSTHESAYSQRFILPHMYVGYPSSVPQDRLSGSARGRRGYSIHK